MLKQNLPFWLFCSLLFFVKCADSPPNITQEEEVRIEDEITNEIDDIIVISEDKEAEKTVEKTLPPPDYDTLKWTEVIRLDTHFIADLKYATTENFVAEKMYECGRCFLRPKAAKALLHIQQSIADKGLRIKLLDCYRPRPVQQRLWNKVPDKRYVTPPERGSMHNRGAAIDLTIVGENGEEWDMGTPYDFFGREGWHTYQGLPEEVLENRRFLKQIMEENGFKSIRTEWWHYSFPGSGGVLSDWEWNCDTVDDRR